MNDTCIEKWYMNGNWRRKDLENDKQCVGNRRTSYYEELDITTEDAQEGRGLLSVEGKN